jgi:hypothetical protein
VLPTKKRVKRHIDGYYYPERKVLFFWVPYDDKGFRTIDNAYRFLEAKHAEELKLVQRVKSVEVFSWEPKK